MQPERYRNKVMRGEYGLDQDIYCNDNCVLYFDLNLEEEDLKEFYSKYPSLKRNNRVFLTKESVKSYKILQAWQYVEYNIDLNVGYRSGPATPSMFTYYHIEIIFNKSYGKKCVIQIDEELMDYFDEEMDL